MTQRGFLICFLVLSWAYLATNIAAIGLFVYRTQWSLAVLFAFAAVVWARNVRELGRILK